MTANGIEHDRPVPHPGLDTWSNRYAAALVDHADAKRKAWEARAKGRADDALDRKEAEALDRVSLIGSAMAADFAAMLRKADELAGRSLRHALKEVVKDAMAGPMAELRTEMAEMAGAIVQLERRRAG